MPAKIEMSVGVGLIIAGLFLMVICNLPKAEVTHKQFIQLQKQLIKTNENINKHLDHHIRSYK